MLNGKAKAEEDLDDLDDVLDQFTVPEPLPQTKSTTVSPPPPYESGRSESKPEADTVTQSAEVEAAFREAWYKMIIQDLEGEGSKGKGKEQDTFLQGGDSVEEDHHTKGQRETSEDEKQKLLEEDSFQKAIRQAMEKLQDSDDTLKTNSKTGQDDLEGLLSSLGDLKLGEDDAEGSENIESMLETMMSQLMSKDILYEPLKELDIKYPDFLSQNASSLPQEDLSRFRDQKARVSQIIAIFEDPSYSDENTTQSTQILRLMNEMQSYGSPPSEIMGPVPPGFELGADGMPKFPDGCVIL